MVFIERAHGSLEGFLAHTKALLNVGGRGLVGEGQTSVSLLKLVAQLVGKVAEAALANALQRKVEFTVGANVDHSGSEHIAGMRLLLKNLIVVDKAGTAVIGNHLEAKGRFLLHNHFHLLTSMILGGQSALQIALHFGRGHNALRLLVDVNVHQVAAPLLHGHFLFAEGHKEVLHQSPVKKGTILVHPCHLQKGEIAHTSQRGFESAHETFALIEINKHVDLRARAHGALHVGFGQEYLAQVAAIEVGAVVGETGDAQCVVVAKVYHERFRDVWGLEGRGIGDGG